MLRQPDKYEIKAKLEEELKKLGFEDAEAMADEINELANLIIDSFQQRK